jgi:hypothetical protein
MVFLAGPLVAIVGIVAIIFVLRRKSVEKRSMYSARREQIQHKVRAARQRTISGHGHAQAPAQQPAATGSPFDQAQTQRTVTYETPAYQPPPAAPPPLTRPPEPAGPMPWDVPSTPAPARPAPAPPSYDYPPAAPEPSRPAPQPTPAAPSEEVWTPAAIPAEPVPPARQTVAPVASGAAAGSWSVVSTPKDSATTAAPESKKKKGKNAPAASSWELASGAAPGFEAEEGEVRRPSGTVVAVAQYAVLVVGLVMVLIGVLVMVANSHVT